MRITHRRTPGRTGADRRRRQALALGLLALGLLAAASLAQDTQEARPAAPAKPASGTAEWFTDVAASSGLDFVHFNGMSGELYFAENVGSGGALFDYDGDGDLDVFLVQGSMLGGKPLEKATFPPRHPSPLAHRLYRNDLMVDAAGERTLRFTDVTDRIAAPMAGYGMGVAAGDYDDDGDVDLYVTAFGPNQMLRNDGGRFVDATAATGTAETRWSVPASFFDYDRDGRLDLYVGNYMDFSIATHKVCRAETGARDYCHPLSYRPVPDRLFRNRGDGGFEEATKKAGIDAADGGALGVSTADVNGDGWIDVYVANDMLPNQLWMNQKDGTFVDDSLLAGVAVSGEGKPEASMGVDAADFDADGDEDLFVANLTGQTYVLYANDGRGLFRDARRETGVGPATATFTGFGAGFLDYDNDGWPDLLLANGAVQAIEALARAGDPYPLHQTKQLLRNLGNGRFEEVTARAGKVFALSEVGRGIAFGDVDNDGDADALVTNNSGPVRLLRNDVGSANAWIGLRLVGGRGSRDMLGARVGVFRPGKPVLWRRVRTDGSYASASDPRVLVGLGDAPAIEKVRVVWPDGAVEEWTDLPVRAYTTLRQGTGRKAAEGAKP